MTDLEKPAPVKMWFSGLEHHEKQKSPSAVALLEPALPVVQLKIEYVCALDCERQKSFCVTGVKK